MAARRGTAAADVMRHARRSFIRPGKVCGRPQAGDRLSAASRSRAIFTDAGGWLMTSWNVRACSRALSVVLVGGLSAATLLAARPAHATNLFASPTGASADAGAVNCDRETPCNLATVGAMAQAGDTVVLLDGTYANQQLITVNSGTASAWITFQADVGAVPIIDGAGVVNPDGGGPTKLSGVGSDTSVYVRFIGIVVRNWASGFSNQWTGSTTEFTANGNWQYINCIGDGNTRNGFAFNSAKGITIHQCISAHNGTSATSSWSSGFQLYGVQGTASDNVVDQNVAFENMDNQKHTDGSGFIVDTMVTGVAFINNLAFLNGGSGIRLTKSANITIANNTFYHNGRDTTDNGPPNPGEIYFTDGKNTQGLTMFNNVGVASGTTQDPTSAWVFNGGTLTLAASNKTSATFAAPDGNNPDFHLTSGNALIDKGDTANAPKVDIGFDPKCIKKVKPTDIQVPSWSAYSIDYQYIKSVGGVAGCWKPGIRPAGAGIDIGAYEYNATPAPVGGATGALGNGGHTGAGGVSGSSGAGGVMASGSGGAPGGGGRGGSGGSGSGSGGASGLGGSGLGGSIASASGGATGTSTGGHTGAGGASGLGGSGNSAAGGNTETSSNPGSVGCACGVAGSSTGSGVFASLLLGLVSARLCARRRRNVRR
jgi:parallel beta-helix repeat protein